ncbi:MAG: pentapeptide repeat-containing protein, partial [Verrucomicrobiota bacterium]
MNKRPCTNVPDFMSSLRLFIIATGLSLLVIQSTPGIEISAGELRIRKSKGALSLECRPSSLTPVHALTIYPRHQIQKSQDGGRTWKEAGSPIPLQIGGEPPLQLMALQKDDKAALYRLVSFFDPETDLTDRDFTEAELSGVDFSGANLSGSIFARAQMVGADLSGCFLDGADFNYAFLDDANLTGASGEASVFIHTKLRKANLEDSVFLNADFRSANLDRAVMKRAHMERCNFKRANLEHV